MSDAPDPTQPASRPRFRSHDWINTNTLEPCFGIQAAVGKRGWMNVTKGDRPFLFDSTAERDEVLKEMLS